MNKQYTVICRDKLTRVVNPQICDGESEFSAVYKFKHTHPEYDVLEVKICEVPHLFPTIRSAALFVTALCAVSIILFPLIIFIINCIVSAYQYLTK